MDDDKKERSRVRPPAWKFPFDLASDFATPESDQKVRGDAEWDACFRTLAYSSLLLQPGRHYLCKRKPTDKEVENGVDKTSWVPARFLWPRDSKKTSACKAVLECSTKKRADEGFSCECAYHDDYFLEPSPAVPATLQPRQPRADVVCALGRLMAKARADAQPKSTSSEDRYIEGLPKQWLQSMSRRQAYFVSRTLFNLTAKGLERKPNLTVIWYSSTHRRPPMPSEARGAICPDDWHLMDMVHFGPLDQFEQKVQCVNVECPASLPGMESTLIIKAFYQRVRLVMDEHGMVLAVCDYYICTKCGKRFRGWDSRLIGQLSKGAQEEYGVVFTWRGAVTTRVLTRLCARTAGNSPAALHQQLTMLHYTRFQT
jgi:hypothetical protein